MERSRVRETCEANSPPRHRFSKKWKGEPGEAPEKQTFWNEFFNVFGVRRRTVATFEEPVKKLSGDWGFIDLFWPGQLRHLEFSPDKTRA